MPRQKRVENKANKESDKKLFAFLATFLSIVGFIIAIIAWKKDKYVMYYAKQSLVIFIIAIVAGVIGSIFFWIPFMGWIIRSGLNILMLVLWVVSWIYALSGEMKIIPIVSDFAKKINL